jgi:broad specificity phosphatase PhoE
MSPEVDATVRAGANASVGGEADTTASAETDTTASAEADASTESEVERQVWLVRHGETEWATLGRHTGRTDIPLTDAGRAAARALGARLVGHPFALVLTSPLSRAADTAALAGFGDALHDDDLMEWDYGALEGRTTPDIQQDFPGWSIWTGPWPDGETADDVGARVDRVIARCLEQSVEGDALLFAHGHLLRVLAARWLGLPATSGSLFALSTATLSILGWDRGRPVIETWNDSGRL